MSPREIVSVGGDSLGLAPTELSSGGPRWEPAEWLGLVNFRGDEPSLVAAAPAPALARAGEADVSQLLERWVRRVGLGGDHRRGVARLDIGAGRLAGTELVVIAEGGAISVELLLPSGAEGAGLEQRLRDRLEGKGMRAEVSVR